MSLIERKVTEYLDMNGILSLETNVWDVFPNSFRLFCIMLWLRKFPDTQNKSRSHTTCQ